MHIGLNRISKIISELSQTSCDKSAWTDRKYDPRVLNTKDGVVILTERIAGYLLKLMREKALTAGTDPYLEIYVDEILNS